MKTIVLTGDHVKQSVQMSELIHAVEEAFLQKGLGRVQMPPKSYLYFRKYNGDLRVMPAYLETSDVSTVKVVNSHPENRSLGLPTVMGLIVLVDAKCGFPSAIMDGTWITAMRTGAASAVATKYLAKEGSRTIGIVGTGVQAITQLMALKQIFKLEEVKAFDKSEDAQEKFIGRMKSEYSDMKFIGVKRVQEAVEDVDIVVTVTPSRIPIIEDRWIKDGVHINAVGADAPGKQELHSKILKRAKIVVDDLEQASHGGEINVPLSEGIISRGNIYAELGEIVAGVKSGRTSKDEVTIFDSTGLAIQDAAAANLVYKMAVERGLGIGIELIS